MFPGPLRVNPPPLPGRQRPASAGPGSRQTTAAGGASSAAGHLRRSGSVEATSSSQRGCPGVRCPVVTFSRPGPPDTQIAAPLLGGPRGTPGPLPAAVPAGAFLQAPAPAAARERPPLLHMLAGQRSASEHAGITTSRERRLSRQASPAPSRHEQRGQSPQGRGGCMPLCSVANLAHLDAGTAGCRPALPDTTQRAALANAGHMRDAEFALLRARYDLRIDVERVRTQSGAAEMRSACDEAVQAQREFAAQQLDLLRKGYMEAEALQRSAHEFAFSEARAAFNLESEKASQAFQEELLDLQRLNVELRTLARKLGKEEEAEKASAAHARGEQEVEASLARRLCEQEATEARRAFDKQREEQIAEVVARFELEHFALSTKLASEIKGRQHAEEKAGNLLARLEDLRHQANEVVLEPPLRASGGEVSSRGTQTDDAHYAADSVLLSAKEESLALHRADLESRLWCAACAEGMRLQVVEERMRRAVALKNDMIDELKDELWRKEREILEARGILSGLDLPMM